MVQEIATACGLAMTGGSRWLVPLRWEYGGCPGAYRGTVITVPYIDMPKLCEFHTPSVSQRPVERAQWSYFTTGLPERNASGGSPQKIPRFRRNEGFSIKIVRIPYAERILATGREVSARLTARRIYQARIGTGTAGRAVSARLTARTTFQSRVWLRAKPGTQSGS